MWDKAEVDETNALLFLAREATANEAWSKAVDAWQEYSDTTGGSPQASLELSEVLKKLGKNEEAAATLRQGLERFPSDERLIAVSAWGHFVANEFNLASALWARYLKLFPQLVDGYVGGGVALRQTKAFDEADRLYRHALERFPLHLVLLRDYAWVSEARRDQREAIVRWRAALKAHPTDEIIQLRLGIALLEQHEHDEADGILASLHAQKPDSPDAAVQYAWVAHRRADWPEALRRWEVVATNYVGRPEGARGAAQALLNLGRPEDARNVLLPSARMSPNDRQLISLRANAEIQCGDFEAAKLIWADLRRKFPDVSEGYIGGASACRLSGEFDKADELLALATSKFSGDVWVNAERARLAQRRGDKHLAIARWSALASTFPTEIGLVAGYVHSLLDAEWFGEAQAYLTARLSESSKTQEFLFLQAQATSRQKDWSRATVLWDNYAGSFPTDSRGVAQRIAAHREAGALSRSIDIIEQLPAHQNALEVLTQSALTLSRARRWRDALPLWVTLRQRAPKDPAIASGITQALWHARQDLEITSDNSSHFTIPESLLNDAGSHDDATLKKLFSRFESIGDTCEFGIVQRRFGAEPLSLLRWASTAPDKLAMALDTDLAGVGDIEFTEISVSHGEYVTRDRRYHMFSHTFTPESSAPYEQFSVQQCKRMKFLREKMLEDLRTAEKILVYKSNLGLADDQITQLRKSIDRHSVRNVLLCLRLADDKSRSGTLVQMGEHLFIGYIDRFSTVDISVNAWVIICQTLVNILDSRVGKSLKDC